MRGLDLIHQKDWLLYPRTVFSCAVISADRSYVAVSYQQIGPKGQGRWCPAVYATSDSRRVDRVVIASRRSGRWWSTEKSRATSLETAGACCMLNDPRREHQCAIQAQHSLL